MDDILTVTKPPPVASLGFCPDLPNAANGLRLLEYARSEAALVLLLGASGTGKTALCRYFAAHDPGIVLVTVNPAATGLVPFLATVAAALRVHDPNQGARALHEAIASELDGDHERRLLIVDEGHLLSDAAIEECRALYDELPIGVALVGNPVLASRWSNVSARKRGLWAQLVSRIGATLTIAAVAAEDVDVLCDHAGTVTAGARKLLKAAALEPGGLREVHHLLGKAVKLARGGPVKAAHIEDAAHARGGRS